jgi:hypothetical protein
MIKTLLLGVWVCGVSLGAAYGVIEWKQRQSGAHAEEEAIKLQEMRSKAINVPIIAGGLVQGYIIAQFVFTVDAKILHDMPINPEAYLLDEAFKTIYAGEKVNFSQLKRQDLPALATQLGENVNKRLGVKMVQDVLIDQLSYVPKEEVRGGNKPPVEN